MIYNIKFIKNGKKYKYTTNNKRRFFKLIKLLKSDLIYAGYYDPNEL